jgi:alpha/beta superfamily hydrolase
MARLLNVDIPAPHGMLEGLLRLPDAADAGDAAPPMAAVVCHPHPQFGGTMHNKVVFRIAQALVDLDIPALRFNFRGVGRSTGTYDEGRGEADDVRAALDELARRYPGVPLCLAGFSFGAWVGLPVGCEDPRVRQLVGVGVPVELLEAGTLTGCDKPKLIVQGEFDQYGRLGQLRAWYERIPEPKRLAVVPGADHFFTNYQSELYAAIVGHFRAAGVE